VLRFIIRHERKDTATQLVSQAYSTLDVACELLEDRLRAGGMGDEGYDYAELIGVELGVHQEVDGESGGG